MQKRSSEYPIDPMILERRSSRSMSSEELSDEDLMPLFEAARWAPSSYNGQPWRFIYAKKNTPDWNVFFNLLVEANQKWCKNAAVLIVLISHKVFEKNQKPSKTHSFDTGAAWENLALQGLKNGLVVHGMQGFDYDKAKQDLNVPDEYAVEAMIAIGKKGNISDLPNDLLERETPSSRKPLSEIIMLGSFQKK